MAREIKTVFALGGETKYRDAIKGISKEQTLLNAELRASENAYDASGDKQKKLTGRAESLTKQIELQKKKIAEAQNAVDQASKRYDNASEALEKMRDAGQENTAEFKKQQKELADAERALTDYKIDVANAESALGKMQFQLANTNKEILLNESRLKKAGEALESVGKKMQKVGEKAENAGEKLSIGISAPLLAAGVAGVKGSMDAESATGKLQATLGATAEEAEALGEIAKSVWANGFGANIDEASNAVAIIKQNLELTGEPLQKFTEGAMTLADVFGADVTESTAAAKTMVDNFGISAQDSLDLITVGFQQGGDFSGELLDTLREYSPQFASMGMSADQMLSILIKGAQAGAWNLDKVGDAVKEFNIRAQDGSKTTVDGFKAIGLNADEMGAAIAGGGEEAQQAFAATVAALAAMKDPLAQNQAGTALFGTQWEDVRSKVIIAMAEGVDGLKDFKGANETATKAAYDDNPAAVFTSAMRELQGAVGPALGPIADIIKDDIAPAIEDVANWFKSLSKEEQGTILKTIALVAATGPVVKVFGTVSSTVGKVTSGLGKYTAKLAEKKAAEVAAEAASEAAAAGMAGVGDAAEGAETKTGGFGTALGGLSGVAGPIALGVVAFGALIGIMALVADSGETLGERIRNLDEDIVPMAEQVANAKGILSDFEVGVTSSGEAVETVRSKIEETEAKISEAYARYHAGNEATRQTELQNIRDYHTELIKLLEQEASIYATKQQVIVEKLQQGILAVTTKNVADVIKSSGDAYTAATIAANETLDAGMSKAIADLGDHYTQTEYKEAIAPYLEANGIALQSAKDLYAQTMALALDDLENNDKANTQKLESVASLHTKIESVEIAWQQKQRELRAEGATEDSLGWSAAEAKYAGMKVDILEGAATTYESIDDEFLAAWISMVDNTVEGGGQLKAETQATLDDLLYMFSQQPDSMTSVGTDMMISLGKAIAQSRGIPYEDGKMTSDELVQLFKDSVDEYEEAGTANVEAYAKGTRKGKPKAEKAGKDVKNAANKPLKDGAGEAGKSGEKTGDKFAGGIRGKKSSANQAGKEVKDATLSPFSTLGGILDRLGASGVGSLVGGIKGKKGSASSATGEVNTAVKTEADKLKGLLEQGGINSVQGLIRGLQNPTIRNILISAARALGQLVNQAYNDAQEITSPSKVMEKSGIHDVEGVIVGIKKKTPDAKEASKEMAGAVAEGFESEEARMAEAQRFLEQQLTGTKLAAQLAYVTSGRMPGAGGTVIETPVSNINKSKSDNSTHVTVQMPGATVRSDNDIKRIARELAVEIDRKKKSKGA